MSSSARRNPTAAPWTLTGTAVGGLQWLPAVTIAFGKRKGANAITVADQLVQRLNTVEGRLVSDNVIVTVTRNYGETATEKANELLFHLALATLTIVVLISIAVGWRAGVWLIGYTINRVSPFALIFSIGILVDDAIDLIFQGLAISLVFGFASSTLSTVLVIPAVYVWLRDDHQGFGHGPAEAVN
jgi:multidrug efflux pump subunit AcrB